ncbi:hypothetical protein J1782_00950 [Rahnella sp. BCC 1045]|uniref:hypothetical protein n=1 Tax=Rahnella sp. BCC 1045 TaxID=2816251 RepID=UPI001C264821|nr:hypothetical protein [Rahnella sp. BCC 1045]MBU9818459.1 hypothetical protein [Rahnella sp. BCC 1045]
MQRRNIIKAGFAGIALACVNEKSLASSNDNLNLKYLWMSMFSEMVIKKNASLAPRFYHPEFRLVSNGQEENYNAFIDGHKKIYETDISYSVRYDESSWIENDSRIGVRMWITTKSGNEQPVEIEVIALAQYLDSLIYRVWELTWPDWSQLDAFRNYNK